MAKSQLQIVASGEATDTLAQICRPSTDVTIEGTVTQANKKKVLLVENIAVQQNTNVPIVTNKVAKARLAKIAGEKKAVSVSMSGRVVDGVGGSALVLDQINQVTSLPLVASAKARQAWATPSESSRASAVEAASGERMARIDCS